MGTIFKAARLLPAVVGAVLVVVFLVKVGAPDKVTAWEAAGFCAVLFVVVAAMRFAVGSLGAEPKSASSVPNDDIGRTRQRIAPLIIGIGAGGIALTALVVMFTITDRTYQNLMGIFSSIVPLFATWVGAVIAFYFSNESFRIAAEAAGIQGVSDSNDPLTGPTRMIPFDKITKVVVPSPLEDGAVAAAGALDMKTSIRPLFGPTVSRVIIFDSRQRVIYILRDKLDDKTVTTVTDYLALNQNATDAKNFQILPQSATVADGRRVLQLFKTIDLFVTQHGDAGEPVIGWLPDDKLA